LKTSGDWQSFFDSNILDASEDNSFGRMGLPKNGTKWMATNRDGVVGFNESNNTFKKNTMGTDRKFASFRC
jgi:hypothetical protein